MSGLSSHSTDVDALFKVPLVEFTSERNALAARLKKAGHQAEANEVKALGKPSVSAWVVNQLYWRHRELFEQLTEAGERLRRAQAGQLTGDAAREPVNARRDALAALAGIAAEILRDGNYSAARDMLRRVTTTLDALSSYGSVPGAPAAGRLTDDLEAPGFEAVAGFLPSRAADEARSARAERATKSPIRADWPDTAAGREEEGRKGLVSTAKAAVREAERTLSVARKRAERAAAKLETAAKHATAVDAERADIEKRLARASEDAEAAHEHAREAAAISNEATKTVEAAEHALELARRGLEQMV